jgi:hypothetical protein
MAAKLTLGEVFNRYACEVSPSKRSHRWEVIRLEKSGRDPIAKIRLEDLSAKDFANWRDRQLQDLAPASGIREIPLMPSVLTVARRDLELISIDPRSDMSVSPSSRRRARECPRFPNQGTRVAWSTAASKCQLAVFPPSR